MGGHRLWTARLGADGSEETYHPDNGRCAVELPRNGFVVTAPADSATRLQRGFHIRASAADHGNPDSESGLSGITRTNGSPGHVMRAAMEGATLGMNHGLQRLKALGVNPKEIRPDRRWPRKEAAQLKIR